MTEITKLTKDEAAALVTRLCREAADLRSKLVDIQQWGQERIADQERIISGLREEIAAATELNGKLRERLRECLLGD